MDPQGRRPGSVGSIPEQQLVIEPIEYRENIFRGYLGSLNPQVFFSFCYRKQGNYQLTIVFTCGWKICSYITIRYRYIYQW